MDHNLINVAIAILSQEGQLLCQLRDDLSTIRYGGYWGLFGGHLDPGETPEQGLIRELKEEINYEVSATDLSLFGLYPSEGVMRYVFHVPLRVNISQLTLLEGWDMDLLTVENIEQGECYSEKAGMVRHIALPHQKILLNFITQNPDLFSNKN